MKNEIDSLLQKEMDRKAFLKHVGAGFIALTGLAALLKTLNGVGRTNRPNAGYGSSTYGGNSNSQRTS